MSEHHQHSPTPSRRLRRAVASIAVIVLLAGCAPGRDNIDRGNDLIAQGDIPGALSQLEAAVKADPNNLGYRAQLVRVRAAYIAALLTHGEQLRAQEQFDAAEADFHHVLELESENARARQGLEQVAADRLHKQQVDSARLAFQSGRADAATAQVDRILGADPHNRAALALRHQIEQSDNQHSVPAGLREGLRRQVTLEFRDANIKAVFESLSRSTGVNFVFDREVKPDLKVTVFLQKTTVEDAIGVLAVTNQLDKKYLNDNTVLIYPNTPGKQKDYQELMVKTFYLSNAEAGKIATMLKTVLKTRDIYADDKLNSVTVRDTPAAIHLVERVIAAQDLPQPEVSLELEVLEVSRSRLTQLGVDPPGEFTLLNIVPSPTQTVAADGSVVTNTNAVTTTSQLTLQNLKHFNAGDIGIPNPKVDIHAELGNSDILANPRIRVVNREKAHVLIGDKVPVITTTSTAQVGVSENVSYLDVGLKLDVEPNVYLDDDVGIKVALEVSSIVKEVTTQTGTLTYQIGTRSATTELRLKDGETQVLAGLINDQERHSTEGIPGAAELPIVNRLFSDTNDQHDKTEIVLLITPHIIRNITSPQAPTLESSAGTENASGALPLRLRAASSIATAPNGQPGPATSAGAASEPAAEPAPAPAPTPAPAPEPAPAAVNPAPAPGEANPAPATPPPANGAAPPDKGATPNPQ